MNLLRWLSSARHASEVTDRHAADARRAEWVVCAIAGRVVGCYGRGMTRRISESIGKSPDTVEHMAAGWMVFDTLRRIDPRRAKALRLRWSWRRFWELGQKLKYDLSPADQFDYLESDLRNSAMGAQIEDMHSPFEPWQRKVSAISTVLVKLSTDAPDDVRRHASGLLAALKQEA